MTSTFSSPKSNPGFQGSETAGVEVTFYRRGLSVGDTQRPKGTLTLTGRSERDADVSIIGVSTVKSMASAGQFTVQVKVRDDKKGGFIQSLQDDDWVDISFTRHARKWHVMRGLVEEIRRSSSVSGAGATVQSFTIIGRDFQKIFETTPIWFNIARSENVVGGLSLSVIGTPTIGGTVAETVQKFLFGFLRLLGTLGRANWSMPPEMPNTEDAFADTVEYVTDGFSNTPPRASISENFVQPQGTIWDLGKQWSDPMFCEMFTEQYAPADLQVTGPDNVAQNGSSPTETNMTVVLRDKPFPVIDPSLGPNVGLKSPWFKLPLHMIPRETVVAQDVGVQGYERYNAFFVSPQIQQDLLGQLGLFINQPLWDTQAIKDHGLRRFEAVTNYQATDLQYKTALQFQRNQLRDWYCLNPLFLSGSLSLAVGHPYIKLGTRVCIPGRASKDQNETFYVEQVSHTWSLGQGMRTSLGVTRGWIGDDNSLVEAITAHGARYVVDADQA